jgi:hypothetical protein
MKKKLKILNRLSRLLGPSALRLRLEEMNLLIQK